MRFKALLVVSTMCLAWMIVATLPVSRLEVAGEVLPAEEFRGSYDIGEPAYRYETIWIPWRVLVCTDGEQTAMVGFRDDSTTCPEGTTMVAVSPPRAEPAP